MSSNKKCEMCSKPGYCDIHFENKCPIDDCINKNWRNHILCKECLHKNSNQIKFDEAKANENISRLKRSRKENSDEFKKLFK
jgi:hypothetical protein